MKSFIKENIDHNPIVDNVFKIVGMANEAIATKGKENVVNATIGALYDEENQLVALNTVFNSYNEFDNRTKAKYASGFAGNANFRQGIYEWVVQDTKINMPHCAIGTPGGSGAVSATILNVLDQGETLVIPNIAWSNYKAMATIASCDFVQYEMFDGDSFNLESFKQTCQAVMDKQGKVLAVVNDPCHNPTGYTMTYSEWEALIEVLNELSKQGPVVLLDDIAYIDYSYDLENSRKYLNTFNNMSENVMIVVAMSCSKTLTSYGLRCGGAIIFSPKQESVESLQILMERHCRASWSNIPNAAMENFVKVTTTLKEEFNTEKQIYIDLLKQRSDIFKAEADACGLEYYPYKEGFFVTLKIEDKELLKKFHQAMLDQDIYTIEVGLGIRVGICAMPIEKVKGLAYKMKDILESVK